MAENEQTRLSREATVAAELASRESEGAANRDQRGTEHAARMIVSEQRQEILNKQVDGVLENYKNLDAHRKATLAQSLKDSALRSEQNKTMGQDRPKRMTEEQARDEARKQTAASG